ncbi:MAG: DNA polymerase subunit beta [Tildeniella nuda ZEHNDER 1965/U140]|jgi:hypothetical protein|nr:DNA polymerase subunit beta [Tildeniella nuda ZEHNDER 1965/U140]
MNMHELVQTKRAEILDLAAKHGASDVRLLSSVPSHEDQPDQAVDFLVTLDADRSLLDYVALVQDFEDLLGRTVTVSTVEGLQENSSAHLLKEAIAL